MPRFFYDAVDRLGRPMPGSLDCESEDRLGRFLQEKGLTLIRTSLSPPRTRRHGRRRSGPVRAGDRAEYAEQIGRLLEVGCPIDRAHSFFLETVQSSRLESAVRRIETELQQGKSYAEALSTEASLFPELFVTAVSAAETGGFLPAAMRRLARFEERTARLRARTLRSLVYPAFLALTMVACLAVVLAFVVPSLLLFLEGSGRELPASTRALLFASGHLGELLSLALAGAVLFSWGLRRMNRSPRMRPHRDALLARFPLTRRWTEVNVLARFCRTLSLLLASGVDLLDALDHARQATGNHVYQAEIARAREHVLSGEALSTALGAGRHFPGWLVAQVRFGEETGELERVLEKLADDYDHAAEGAMESAAALVEPASVVVMGLLMGAVILAIFEPVVQMAGMP